MKSFKVIFEIFGIMFKIGLFTFGGGYAMIAFLENEFVSKRRWLLREEFMDMVAIAESTPGPIAINAATYIGYKLAGFFGSLFATVAICIPSFVIIYLISLFFDAFLELTLVSYAFRGIQVGVIYLISMAGIKMLSALKPNFFNVAVISATVVCMLTFTLFSVSFSSIFYILIAGVLGLALYLVSTVRGGKGEDHK